MTEWRRSVELPAIAGAAGILSNQMGVSSIPPFTTCGLRAFCDAANTASTLCALQKLAAALGKNPFDQRGFGEGPLPDFVVHAGIFGIERVAARFASGGDAFAGDG